MSDTTYKSKVGYKPPVELDYHEGTPEIKSVWDNMRDSEGKILDQMEEHIVAQCSVAVGVKIDREELIKALRYDRGQYEKGYADGKRDAAAAIEELLSFAHYVADKVTMSDEDWEDYHEAFTEVACRKLVKLGVIFVEDDMYVYRRDEPKEVQE